MTSPLKINKYLYGWKLSINYGQGWEYETFEETFKQYKENARLYRGRTVLILNDGLGQGN